MLLLTTNIIKTLQKNEVNNYLLSINLCLKIQRYIKIDNI